MSDYAKTVEKHRRLAILKVLLGPPAGPVNDSILTDMVNAHGVTSSRDQVRTSIGWLEEQGLAKAERLQSLVVASITARGVDVAKGRALVDGVQPPTPGA